MMRKPAHLQQKLDELASRYDRKFLQSDPIQFPHRYTSPRDREVAAFIAAVFAYGSVKQILGSVGRFIRALETISASPHEAILNFSIERDSRKLDGFHHRFNDARDAVCLILFLQQILRSHGSIEAFFDTSAPRQVPLRERIAAFSSRALALDYCKLYGNGALPDDAGVRFFFTNPNDGSACKRLCMFLRWVVRPDDGIDLGLWQTVLARELVMPLDTHTTRICYLNGLCPSPFATWRNAEHVTEGLRRFDANDPVRYDFAISRLGILRVQGPAARVRMSNSKLQTKKPSAPTVL
ncbi:MAG: TIGR02757 family protein [Planctomycetes bacterium]|nr:TIGR02757 family protein [Planctomycetota bacterium]